MPDQHITTYLDVAPWFDRKWAAVLAHRTQMAEGSWFMTLPDEVRRRGFGREAFILAASRVDAPSAESDLFAGLR